MFEIGPGRQFHWTVLPQSVTKSPIMCQEFVAAAIEPTRHKYPEAYVLHYMGDILISRPSESTLLLLATGMVLVLSRCGVEGILVFFLKMQNTQCGYHCVCQASRTSWSQR
jgi:hypothetical protein